MSFKTRKSGESLLSVAMSRTESRVCVWHLTKLRGQKQNYIPHKKQFPIMGIPLANLRASLNHVGLDFSIVRLTTTGRNTCVRLTSHRR